VTMCPVVAASIASVCVSVLPDWGSGSSGVLVSGSLPVLGVAGWVLSQYDLDAGVPTCNGT
jgi:hypothetical protein